MTSDKENKLSIEVWDISIVNSKAGGFYTLEGKKIVINESLLRKGIPGEQIACVLCHEFIHFLVHRQIENEEMFNENIKNGGFIDEAMTESLTRKNYSDVPTYYWGQYDCQVDMMNFANLLSGEKSYYNKFLRGKINGLRYDESKKWWGFYDSVRKSHQELEDYHTKLAANNENYVKAQRELIETLIDSMDKELGIDRYIEIIMNLSKRPVDDNKYIDNFINTLQNTLIRNLGYQAPLKNFAFNCLKEYTDSLMDLNNIRKYKSAYIFEHDDVKFVIKEDGKVEIINNMLPNGEEKFRYCIINNYEFKKWYFSINM